VLAEQIASSALSSDNNHRPTTKTETMATNPHVVTDAMWHRSALDTKDTDPSLFANRQSDDLISGRNVSLDDVMLHTNRILNDEDGYEREHYVKELITEEGGSSSARRDSLGSPSDFEKPNILDEIMLHQNRILHNEDGFMREDYITEKSSTLGDLLVDSESSIYS